VCDDGDDDDDNDGVADAEDGQRLIPFACRDLDQDGCDDCSVSGADGSGGDPLNDGVDTDGDGVGDACDGDGDGAASGDDSADGVPQGGLFSFCSPSPMATLSATLLTLVGLRLRIRGRVRRRKVV
jgi:hypothetical protein